MFCGLLYVSIEGPLLDPRKKGFHIKTRTLSLAATVPDRCNDLSEMTGLCGNLREVARCPDLSISESSKEMVAEEEVTRQVFFCDVAVAGCVKRRGLPQGVPLGHGSMECKRLHLPKL